MWKGCKHKEEGSAFGWANTTPWLDGLPMLLAHISTKWVAHEDKSMLPRFWSVEVPSQGVGRSALPLRVRGGSFPILPAAGGSRGAWASPRASSLCPHKTVSPLCMCLPLLFLEGHQALALGPP